MSIQDLGTQSGSEKYLEKKEIILNAEIFTGFPNTENLKKSRPKNSSNEMNQFHGIFFF